MRHLSFLLFFFLRGYQNLFLSNFFFEFGHFVLRNNKLAIRLAAALLELVDMRLKLFNYISQLLVFIWELRLDSLKPHLVMLGILHLNLFHFWGIKAIVIFKFYCAEFNFEVPCALFSFTALALLLKQHLSELASLSAMTLNQLLYQLLIASVHGIHVCLLFVCQPVTLPV